MSLRVERRDRGVVLLTLDLPERRNAMTPELTAAWGATMGHLRTDPELRAVVVTGAGAAFCAGGDLSWLTGTPEASVVALRERMLPFYRTWLSVLDLEVPTLAAINGAAVGAGLALALACDLRWAAPDARLSVPFTALGIHPGMATTWLLPQVAGLAVARDLLLTGRSVRGAEAVSLGLVNGCVPADALLDEVLATADRIAGNAPVATRLTKVALSGGGHLSLADALRWEALAQPVTMATADLVEGLAAAREGRPPRWPNGTEVSPQQPGPTAAEVG